MSKPVCMQGGSATSGPRGGEPLAEAFDRVPLVECQAGSAPLDAEAVSVHIIV